MDVEDLAAIEAVKQLKYRYLRCLDTKDWAGMAEVLAPACTASYGGGAYAFEGRDEILSFLERTMGSTEVLSSHRVHHPEIQLDADREGAEARWALDDTVLLLAYEITVRGSAYYQDRYELDDDGIWRIAHTGYRRIFEEIQPRAPVEGLTVTASWWGTDGRSTLSAD